MTSPELLSYRDRCSRLAFWSQRWGWNRIHPVDALRQAIEAAVTETSEDPGQTAGDAVMGFGAERGFDTTQGDLYSLGIHYAGLADVITTSFLARYGAQNRPHDIGLASGVTWQPAALLDPSGVRLRRIVLASRWDNLRKLAEERSYFSLFETCVYELPMTMTICVIGQERDGRRHSPWSKGYQHPMTRGLRFRRRSGTPFRGDWKQVWREEEDIQRDSWLEAMEQDQVMQEVCFEVEIPVPAAQVVKKIVTLADRRLQEIGSQTEVPAPSPSQCWFPSRCQFVDACWTFTEPCPRLGYVKIETKTA